jgi:hypothetical protein
MVIHTLVRAHSRLYTTETSEPPCVPSVDAFTIDPPLKGIPPKFISPMYTNLWANTPRDAMTYADKEFPDGTPYFPFRKQILQYLKEYGNDIRPLVEFNKEVARVEKNGKWCLTIRDLLTSSKKETVEEFDAVAVATGSKKSGLSNGRTLRYSEHTLNLRNPDFPCEQDYACEILPSPIGLRK